MKKIIIFLCLMLAAYNANAQGLLDALKGAAGKAVAGLKDQVSNPVLDGNWSYSGCAIKTSSDDILASVASAVASGAIESKFDEYLSKIGIKPGVASLYFGENNEFKMSFGAITLPGNWTQDGKNLTIKFGKLMTYLQLDGTVTSTETGYQILFSADKFATFAEAAANAVSSLMPNSVFGSLTSSLGNIKGVNAGFKLTKTN